MDFISSEHGAVTVDWVVLAAAVVGLGLGAVGVVSVGMSTQSTALSDRLKQNGIATSFYGDDAPTWQSFVDHSQMEMSLGGQVILRSTGGSDDTPGYIELIDDAGVLDMVDLGHDFSGDQTALLGDTIAFDVGVFAGGHQPAHGAADPLLQITDTQGNLLTYHSAQVPDGTPGVWTTFAINVDPTAPGWTMNGDPVTEATMTAVLTDVASVELRGEHYMGDETIGIDNLYITHRASGLDYR